MLDHLIQFLYEAHSCLKLQFIEESLKNLQYAPAQLFESLIILSAKNLHFMSIYMTSCFHFPPVTVTEPSLCKKEPSRTEMFLQYISGEHDHISYDTDITGFRKKQSPLYLIFIHLSLCSLHIHASKQEYSCHTWLQRGP